MTVYIEYAIADNFIMDYLLLKATLAVTRVKGSLLRTAISSAIGTAVAVLLPLTTYGRVADLLIKLFLACTMVLISGEHKTLAKYIRSVGFFVFATFFTGGTIYAVISFLGVDVTDTSSWSYNTPVPIGVNILCGYLSVKIIIYTVRRIYKKRDVYPFVRKCSLVVNGKEISLKGYIDSGNRLQDEKSGLPITVISKKAISDIVLDGESSIKRGKYVWFSTVSGRDKMYVFTADKLRVFGKTDIEIDGAPIGISPTPFKDDGDYDLLLSPTIF